jgi:hypothetical protein
MGWGCTIRVMQMMVCHSILRHRLSDYTLPKLLSSPVYMQVLHLINDNTDGANGAFSIQNIARMGVIFNKYPCEWHGNRSISVVFNALNKLFKPINNFETCVFGDGTIIFDKIEKAGRRQPRVWLFDALNKLTRPQPPT